MVKNGGSATEAVARKRARAMRMVNPLIDFLMIADPEHADDRISPLISNSDRSH